MLGTSTTSSFTVTNNGASTTGTLTVLVSGGTSGTTDFSVADEDCNGSELAVSGTCNVQVRFQPTSAGAKSATFTVSGTPGGTAAVASLTGTGLSPEHLTISPNTQDYGQVVIGSSTTSSFTVTNTGQASTGTLKVLIAGGLDGTSDFSVVQEDCRGTALPAVAICHLRVMFQPTSAGPKTATLTVSGTPGGTVAAASLTGEGLDDPSSP